MTTLGPPHLVGYEFVRELGRGGFADVFLYEHLDLEREVAVKVLRQRRLSDEDHTQFRNEARRMARLANHPGIVQVFDVGVADDGRPYISMEFCPNGHFAELARAQPLRVDRALQVGIHIAGAVQSAHNAEILHRDLKPANILLTALDEPALTDFGIAGTHGVDDSEAVGVSIPFAAPEVVGLRTSGDERSDVYSLGATIYALLAGRSPFSTGERMTQQELMGRVLHDPLPPIGRADVPEHLENVLANAMDRDPGQRPASAAAFGRALQGVEAALGLPATRLRVIEPRARRTAPGPAAAEPADADEDDRTHQRSVQRVDPDLAPADPAPRLVRPTPSTPARDEHPLAPEVHPVVDDGLTHGTIGRGVGARVHEPEEVDAAPTRGEEQARRNRLLASVGGGVALVLLLVFVIARPGSDDPPPVTTTRPPDTAGFDPGPPARPVEVEVAADVENDQTVVSWTPGQDVNGDTYLVTVTDGPAEVTAESPYRVDEPTLLIASGDGVCLEVATVRGGRVSEPSSEVCTP